MKKDNAPGSANLAPRNDGQDALEGQIMDEENIQSVPIHKVSTDESLPLSDKALEHVHHTKLHHDPFIPTSKPVREYPYYLGRSE